jgi:hypothetical protein
VRPTPSATDQTTFALDVLTALGKNPEVLTAEKLGLSAWDYALAWLAAAPISNLVIDRAHRLTADHVGDLAELATMLQCRVWLIWSGGGDLDAVAASVVGVRQFSVMPHNLPMMPSLPSLPPPRGYRFDDRVLPTVEFTTFRAPADATSRPASSTTSTASTPPPPTAPTTGWPPTSTCARPVATSSVGRWRTGYATSDSARITIPAAP